jgi:vacuolar-type H+-ATPase subunit I/STV1
MSMTDLENMEEVGPWARTTFNPLDWIPTLPSHYPIDRPPARLGHHERMVSDSRPFTTTEVRTINLEESEESIDVVRFPSHSPNSTPEGEEELLEGIAELEQQQNELMEQIEMLEQAHEHLDMARNELMRVLMQIEHEMDEELPAHGHHEHEIYIAEEDEESVDSETDSSCSEELEIRYLESPVAIRGLGLHRISPALLCLLHERQAKAENLDANGDPIIGHCAEHAEYILDR